MGAKVVELSPGRPDAPPIADLRPSPPSGPSRSATCSRSGFRRWPGSTPPPRPPSGARRVNAIAGSIRRGEGSLGKLIRDESAYQSLLDLSHRGERSLTALDENLTALKQTWPLSRYFDHRAISTANACCTSPVPSGIASLFSPTTCSSPVARS